MSLETTALESIASAASLEVLDGLRVSLLGKKGSISALMQTLGGLSPEERKSKGAEFNQLKQRVEAAFAEKHALLERAALAVQLEKERVDVTLPPRPVRRGLEHPIPHVCEEILSLLSSSGFQVVDGPEIEDDFHNFTALNVPPHHPARQMQDTFYLRATEDNGAPLLLRTHTSSLQIRTMEKGKPPFRIVAPGRVYRSDYDATHTPMFHQIEGVWIDKGIHMGHLKECLLSFLRAFFEVDDLPVRFRPSFFPFTEPSAEVDIGCVRENGALRIGGGTSWLEVLGSGMVHPNVLSNVGLDPKEWQGFAFGLGVERLAMLKYGVPDLRSFFESDVRWLEHYGFGQ